MPVFEASVQGGQLVLSSALPFPDGTKVLVRVESPDDDPLLFIGSNAVQSGVPDLADQHDHYVYGVPPTIK